MDFKASETSRLHANVTVDVTCPWCDWTAPVTLRINVFRSGAGWEVPTTFFSVGNPPAREDGTKSRIVDQHGCPGPG